jgi:hypothetical protein
MPTFAAETTVPADRSRSEIERTLTRYGAHAFMYGWQGSSAMVAFEAHNRRIRFILPMPDKSDPSITHTQHKKAYLRTKLSDRQQEIRYDQQIRQRWRALALVIKAKLEAVEAGITTFEEEFLAHIMLPNGQTVAGWIAPQLDNAYANNTMPALMPGVKETP